MGGIFGGQESPKYEQVGKLPNVDKMGSAFSKYMSGFIGDQNFSPSGGSGLFQQYAFGLPTGDALARRREMLSSDWLSGSNPQLDSIASLERAQAEKDLTKMRQDLTMRFGAAGQTNSSPFARALMEGENDYRSSLAMADAQRRYSDYGNRLALQSQAVSEGMQLPLAANQAWLQRNQAFWGPILQYLTGGQGQVVDKTPRYVPGLLDTILGSVSYTAG